MPTVHAPDLMRLVRAAIAEAGGVRPLARKWGVSPAHVCDMKRGFRRPGPRVLRHLGLKKVVSVTYIAKEK